MEPVQPSPDMALTVSMLLLALLVGVGVIILLIKGNKTTRWVLSIFGIILLVLLGLRFTAHIVHAPASGTRIQANQQLPSPAVTPPVWMPGIARQFAADTYPSMMAAAKGLARQLRLTIPDVIAHESNPPPLQVIGNVERPMLNEIAQFLRDSNICHQVKVIEDKVLTSHQDQTTQPPTLSVNVTIKGSATIEGRPPYTARHGTIKMSVLVPGGTKTETASFCEKPWIDNFAEFTNRNPQAVWILARSQNSCTTPNQAAQEALQDAVQQLRSRFRITLKGKGDVTTNTEDLHAVNMITDRFAQSFQGSASPIWREALLVDASLAKLKQLARHRDRQMLADQQAKKSDRHTWLRRIASLAAMLVLICVVYFFLDVATKGYYTWALRIAMIILLSLGVFLLLFMS